MTPLVYARGLASALDLKRGRQRRPMIILSKPFRSITEVMDPKTADQHLSEKELRLALCEGRFELHYQPQFPSRDNRMTGVEGLARLRCRAGHLIYPRFFISQIEKTSLIHDFGAQLFAQGCHDAALWPKLTVAINVSPKQFDDPGFPRRLIDIAESANVDLRRIEIEITEGLLFDRPEYAKSALGLLNEAGFLLALDDFGTGYSSLISLLRFPITKIKIDRSFVIGTPSDRRSVAIVHAVVALSRSLGLKVVAEGVETEDQRIFLRTAGCHFLQGFLLAAAQSREEISAALRSAQLDATGEPNQL